MTCVVRIRDVVVSNVGSRNPTRAPDEAFIYVDVAAVDNSAKVITGARPMLGADAPSRARKLIRHQDVLVSTVRPNLNAVAMVPAELDGQIASTGFCVLRATEQVLPEYLYYFTRAEPFVDSLSSLVAGAMYPAVTDSQVLDQELPLRSITEQRRIVDLISRAEGIVRLRREAEKKAAELIPALFLDMFGDPATNPKGWPRVTIGGVASYTRYGPRFPARQYSDSGAHILRTTDMGYLGELRWKDAPVLPVTNDELRRFALQPGTLLVTRTGATIGKLALFTGAGEACIAGAYLIEVGLMPDVVPEYVLWYLLSEFGQTHLIGGSRTVAQPNLNAPTIRAIPLLLPPVALQREFAAKLTDVQSIRTQQTTATDKAQAAFDALLATTFNRHAEAMA